MKTAARTTIHDGCKAGRKRKNIDMFAQAQQCNAKLNENDSKIADWDVADHVTLRPDSVFCLHETQILLLLTLQILLPQTMTLPQQHRKQFSTYKLSSMSIKTKFRQEDK